MQGWTTQYVCLSVCGFAIKAVEMDTSDSNLSSLSRVQCPEANPHPLWHCLSYAQHTVSCFEATPAKPNCSMDKIALLICCLISPRHKTPWSGSYHTGNVPHAHNIKHLTHTYSMRNKTPLTHTYSMRNKTPHSLPHIVWGRKHLTHTHTYICTYCIYARTHIRKQYTVHMHRHTHTHTKQATPSHHYNH